MVETSDDIEATVVQALWEPRHEWEARVKFVEDYSADCGLERAINLSLVWANMKFLGCSYPAGTEALVKLYEVPSLEELRARRKCKNSIAKYKRTSSATTFEEVSALLSSIHTQSSIKATHPQLQMIANETCLCKDCLGPSESESYSDTGLKILEHMKKSRKDFDYELIEGEGGVCSLVLNGGVVLKRNTSKVLALEDFFKMLNNWQEANQKPACPLVASAQPGSGSSSGFPSNSSPQSHSDYYSSSPRQGMGGYSAGRGSPYQQGSRGGRGSPYQQGSGGGRGSPYQRGGGSGGRHHYQQERGSQGWGYNQSPNNY